MKLAVDIATEGLRPPIRESWNPAMSFLITSCWSDLAMLRLDLGQVMSSLSMIMTGLQGLITLDSAKAAAAEAKKAGPLHLAPGALWRRVKTIPKAIVLGEIIGQGSYSKVHKGTFQKKQVAVKIFRNTSEESAFKEIEIMFSLRHPNVIGLYAWFQLKGGLRGRGLSHCFYHLSDPTTLSTFPRPPHTTPPSGAFTQTGIVIEIARGGDLRGFYAKKREEGSKYSFKLALKIILGAAKGLAHMHSMPTPIVHRDVKSSNIMVMSEGGCKGGSGGGGSGGGGGGSENKNYDELGKLGDCGESRRVDLNATMTQTGSPLWAAVSQAQSGMMPNSNHHPQTLTRSPHPSPSSSRASTTARTSTRTPLASSCSRSRRAICPMPSRSRSTRGRWARRRFRR